MDVTDLIGCDLGRKNILSTSDGKLYCGDSCEANRKKYVRLRQKFQRAGTKLAYKHLGTLDGHQTDFKASINHWISKELVAEAKGTGRGIALEELTYIPRSARDTKAMNDGSSKWAFAQLRFDIVYKAKLAGASVVLVDPHTPHNAVAYAGSSTSMALSHRHRSYVCVAVMPSTLTSTQLRTYATM